MGSKNALETSPVDWFKGFPIISEIVQCCYLNNFINSWNNFLIIILSFFLSGHDIFVKKFILK